MAPTPARALRPTAAGAVLLVFTVAFALFMASIAPRSSDPAALMRLVGGIGGALGALSVALIAVGLARRRPARR